MPGLYLHIPYCEKKCVYCDFYSVESMKTMENFLRALLNEIDLYADFSGRDETFETVYFGGGTPSLLSAGTIRRILDRLSQNFRFSSEMEITLETNPGTVDLQKLRDYYRMGVNRLSIGVQSFHDEELRFLGRIHSASEAERCVRMAYEAGFDNVSLDLIYALPNQSLEVWEGNLSRAVNLSPKHISAYSLIVEEGTPLHTMVRSGKVRPVGEDTEAEMYRFTMDYLASCGFEHYEVSNYALPGYRSRHNSLYWSHEGYLGFGPSAHSYWCGWPLEKPTRWWNFASVGRYCDQILKGEKPVEGNETLEREDLRLEKIFLSLRTGGVDLEKLRQEHGIDLLERCRGKVERYIREKLLLLEQGKLRLTKEGFLLCDGIALDLSA
jgi:oxygen-independent coproporphyrinogen-3 oxidase